LWVILGAGCVSLSIFLVFFLFLFERCLYFMIIHHIIIWFMLHDDW
jgi:hypothetical protein